MSSTIKCRVRMDRDTLQCLANKLVQVTNEKGDIMEYIFSDIVGMGDPLTVYFRTGVVLTPKDGTDPVLKMSRVRSHYTSFDIEMYNVMSKLAAINFVKQVMVSCSFVDNIEDVQWDWVKEEIIKATSLNNNSNKPKHKSDNPKSDIVELDNDSDKFKKYTNLKKLI